MDILIKSFNRPYYLDRCLFSIQNYLKGFDGKIVVLDDGTPAKYLERIVAKYPNVTIRKSEFYKEKSEVIALKEPIAVKKIPIRLWLDAARDTSDYFLLLEDDIWFTSAVDYPYLKVFVSQQKIEMVKLFWLGNEKLISGHETKKDNGLVLYRPEIFTRNPFAYRLIFKMTRFKIRQIMTLLGLYSSEKNLQYYSVYSVAGAVFHKDYFLRLWEGHDNQVDEKLQIWNALKFLNKNPQCKFGRTEKEVLKTGFATSATNFYKDYDTKVDMFEVNFVLNEAWYSGEFDTTVALFEDLSEDSIIYFLEKSPIASKTVEWKKWSTRFKEQYETIGCKID
ncbi:glycosyltransferase family 2 protein [Flavobacterium enshiense]|uniref:glycosyltransferase family 2 protein n=1 Tax=Flavobacterium enshiense TaxID=1341165 RepID=UPI00345DED91